MTEDLETARLVGEGDPGACEAFVEQYTDLVLYRVGSLMKTHCRKPARQSLCSLVLLQRQRKGQVDFPLEQCDECMDSYIWFFDFLKKKLKAYRGDGGCSLGTFVWSLINSHTTYVEWLRWKYGRAY